MSDSARPGRSTTATRPIDAAAGGGTGRPLRADAKRNRRRILAAREVFAQRGLEAGLDEVARHAGVGTGTVYRRFSDKRELISALFEERLEQVLALTRAAAEHPDPWQAFAGLSSRWSECRSRTAGSKT